MQFCSHALDSVVAPMRCAPLLTPVVSMVPVYQHPSYFNHVYTMVNPFVYTYHPQMPAMPFCGLTQRSTANLTPVPKTKRRDNRASLRAQVVKQLQEKNSTEDSKKRSRSEVLPYCKTIYVALDCEMVGVGSDGRRSALARVSICDINGNGLLDCLVKPEEEVTDYRTHVTGIKRGDLDNAATFDEVRIKVIDLIQNKILVGHALENDLKVLELAHRVEWIRDTAHFKELFLREKAECPWMMPGLKKLVAMFLPADFAFRKGTNHDSLEDARAPMEIYKRYWREFEREVVSGSRTCCPTFLTSQQVPCALL